MAFPPDVIAFDVVGSLFSLASLEPLLVDAGAAPATAERWFERVLAEGFALTAAGDYRCFADVAGVTLESMLPAAPPHVRKAVLAGLGELEPYVDSGPAMGRAVQGARVIVVSNGTLASTQQVLERGGLDIFVETVVSVEDVGAWKPAPAVYLQAADAAHVPVDGLAMVTAHPWDVHGARRAGLTTGWCNRDATGYPAIFEPAEVEGPELLSTVEALLALR